MASFNPIAHPFRTRPDGADSLSDRSASHTPPMRRKTLLLTGVGLAAALAFGLSPNSAVAAAVDSTMAVSSTVQPTCLNTVTPLAFGIYTGAVATATATVTVTCTNTTPYTVALDGGVGVGHSETARSLTGPAGALLNYVLTSDAGHSVNWGTTAGAVSGTGTGSAQPITIYGQEALGQYVAPGAYADTITATVNY